MRVRQKILKCEDIALLHMKTWNTLAPDHLVGQAVKRYTGKNSLEDKKKCCVREKGNGFNSRKGSRELFYFCAVHYTDVFLTL